MFLRLLAPMLALLATDAHARQEVRVVDADTIVLDGQRIRLHGIDAPESAQLCPDRFRAGMYATAYLRQLIAGHTVECQFREWDKYYRQVSVCRAGGKELNAALVEAGWAWAYTKYSAEYVDQEAAARSALRGVHAHDCIPPWDWRRLK